MGRLCLVLMIGGGVIGLLAAGLFDGLSGPGDGEYFGVSSYAGGRSSLTEPARYLLVAAAGAVVGAVGGGLLHLAGVRVEGRRRVGLTVGAGLLGCAVGVAPALITAATVVYLPDALSPLALYAVCGVASFGLALAAVYLALRVVGDPAAKSTAQATAMMLPVGALVATVAGMAGAWELGYSTVLSTWVVVISVVVVVLGATFSVARAFGLRLYRREAAD